MFGSTLATLVLPIILAHLAPGVLAAPTPPPSHAHTLAHVPRAEPHEVDALFKRQTPLDPHSPDFASHYPPAFTVPSPAQLPAAWRQRLAALRLPGGCPQASGSGNPSYNGMNPGDGGICSFTYGCSSSEDLKDAPAGWLAISFDDGPAAGTDLLWSYMGENRARGVGTHFMIGSYIVNNPGTFQDVAREGHIGVHTWSHKYTTTLSNEEIVGELGWTMQLMADLNGGRIPRFWRPPYGDVDNRVRAIAKGVFGLETVTWNEDTGDWNIGYNPAYTVASVTANYLGWLGGDKARGLNVLQHELSTDDVAVFSNVLPRARAMGWAVGNVADSFGMAWYQNADGASGPVRGMSVGGQAPAPSPSPSPSPSGGASAPARPSDVSSAAIPSASASASTTNISTVPSVAPSTASSAVQSSSAPSSAASSATQNNQARPSASASVTSGASALAGARQSVALVLGAALAAVMSL